jgi:hypothetical protein
MNAKKIISTIVGGGLVIAAAFGAVATYHTVFAQTPTPNTSTPSSQPGNAPGGPKGGMRDGGYTEDQLASALGITVDKLQAAEQTATSEALKQAVADGTITQSQADQFAQNSGNGRGFGDEMFLRDSNIDYNALLAKALGITTDQLKAARQTATFAAIDQAVTAGNMTQTQADAAKARYLLSNSTTFQSSLNSAFQAAVKQAVTDGLITQAQADALLSSTNGQLDWGMRGGFDGFGGGHGGHGGPGGRDGFAPNSGSGSSTAPTTTPSGSGL